jgi:hypothetical protein
MRRAGGVDSCTSYLRASGPGGLLFPALCLTASAGVPAPDAPPRAEYFTRFEVSDNYASGYVGGGYAFGKAGLYELGFRLRAAGANGRYHAAITMTARFSWTATTLPTNFEGQAAYLAALVGYQYQPGRGSSNSSPASKPKTSISSRTTRTTRCRAVRSVSGWQAGELARSVGDCSLRRRNLRHRVPGILGAGAAEVSRPPAPLARTRGGRARQRGI